MPIILVNVPRSADDPTLKMVRSKIKHALANQGIDRKHITVEFPTCQAPERLVIRYSTRSAQELLVGDTADQHAIIVGKIVETELRFPVECFVAVFPKTMTAVYLTPVSEDKEPGKLTPPGAAFMKNIDHR